MMSFIVLKTVNTQWQILTDPKITILQLKRTIRAIYIELSKKDIEKKLIAKFYSTWFKETLLNAKKIMFRL